MSYPTTSSTGPIGIFDSGYGGLTILDAIQKRLPQYDYLYLGDNARTPYGTRSFDVVYQYTLESVKKLFELNCQLIILACNTASAKALRTIQQHDLPQLDPYKRVLGVIRPTVEALGEMTRSKHVGIVGTTGTVQSQSYEIEVAKLFPDITIVSEACPMWVPLVENGEHLSPGADYFVEKHLNKLFITDPDIDTLVLGCTHYPLLIEKIRKYTPSTASIVIQGPIIAERLENYLKRHSNLEERCSKNGTCHYLTTESVEKFETSASIFINKNIKASHVIV
ncbi:MAG: glutamate racemase [Microbacter sp.]